MDRRSLPPLFARLLVGGIFLLAAIPKIQSPGAFADAIRAYHLLPPSLVLPLAFMLPWLELAVAAYLLAGYLSRFAGLAVTGLLGLFVVALIDALVTGNTAHPCGCFGANTNPLVSILAGGSSIGWWDAIRDIILAALSLLVAVYGPGPLSIDHLINERASADLPTPPRRQVARATDAPLRRKAK